MKDCTHAKVGDKVISRNGEMKGVVLAVGLDYSRPLAIKITEVNGAERDTVVFLRADGQRFPSRGPSDFFLTPAKKTVWIRMLRRLPDRLVYSGDVYPTRERAEQPSPFSDVEVLPAVEYTYEE